MSKMMKTDCVVCGKEFEIEISEFVKIMDNTWEGGIPQLCCEWNCYFEYDLAEMDKIGKED